MWPSKDALQYLNSRIRLISKRGNEYFTVKFGITSSILSAEEASSEPIFRSYGLHLAALGHLGTWWDRILDKLPWLEWLLKPIWEIFTVVLKFVK